MGRRLPSGIAEDEEERRLGIAWGNLRVRINEYKGIPIDEKKDEDYRRIAEIIERLERKYAFGTKQIHFQLGKALEIENWCKENFRDKSVWERRLPSSISEDEEEKN